jgi:Fur family peroxide stress response transcriptional regulator
MATEQSELDRRLLQLARACRRAGLRVTHQRLEVFRALAASQEHPDAETIYERVRQRVPTMSRDTVYRTLCMLERQGLISRVEVLCERARFDSDPTPHHHVVCTGCGKVGDFRSEHLDRFRVPGELKSWGRVDALHAELRGTCAECLARARGRRPRD